MSIDLESMGRSAREAARYLNRATTDQKNAALYAIADALDARSDAILAANTQDIDDARAKGLDAAMLDRLSLKGRLKEIAQDVRQVAKLPDPVGEIFDAATLPNGLEICKRRTPIGVLGVIYEARPNVTVDIAVLALKTGNAVIMRGGSETLRSNIALMNAIHAAIDGCGFPAEAIQLITDTDRRYVNELLKLHQYVDMIIPRGGSSLHKLCRENSTIPVITGGLGICHLYVDPTADLDPAIEVIHNAKVQRPTVCNALDTLLVNRAIAADFIPRVIERLGASGVTFRLDPVAWSVLKQPADDPRLSVAGPTDWDTEWMSLILGIRVVDNLDEVIEHIQQHSTQHSDGILTHNEADAERVINEIDSAAVYVNASTRFTDGGQFGLGAEVAISTQKLHARGPMGLRELTSYKWVVHGQNHVRA